MKYSGITVLVVGLALAAGCSPPKQTTPEQFKARLDAADAMSNPGQQEEARKKIAEEAADAGEADVARKAWDKLSNPGTKEELAEACALKFAKRGDLKAARAFADLMSNPGRKEEVLRKIANGGQ
jgi:ribosomal protein L29